MDALRWTDEEISASSEILIALYSSETTMRKVVDGPLRERGMYVRYHQRSGAELLAQAWTDAARGMNRLIDVYGEGKKPRYAEIDSAAFDVASPAYGQMVATVAQIIGEEDSKMHLFFEPSLALGLRLLEINKRDEAGRLEPLELKENAAAVKKIRTIDWARFPYTVIVVPGAGGDRNWNLSPAGKLRVEIAARRYRDGKAPLILVSGGYVHPNQTPFAEAVEMKRSLMADFGILEEAILIDPHARHTTTNMRNAARLMYRYGVPFDRWRLLQRIVSRARI